MSIKARSPLPEGPGIIFMGTPDFAVPSLKGLIDAGHKILAVVTQPDRPKGRGKIITASPVKQLALIHGIKVFQTEKVSDTDFLEVMKGSAPDIIIVAAFGQILKKELLDIPPWGVINIHASLLPRYRGAAPIQRAILDNESMTGLTIMRVEEGLDTGPVLYQKEIPILKDETAGQLHDRLAAMSGDLLIEFIRRMSKGQIKETVQDPNLATYAKKIDKEMCRIDWSRDATSISALIRALDPVPGAYTTIGNNNVKLYSSSVIDDTFSGGAPGSLHGNSEEIMHIETGKGIIGVKEIQLPGKKRLLTKDFLRGFNLHEGTILGK